VDDDEGVEERWVDEMLGFLPVLYRSGLQLSISDAVIMLEVLMVGCNVYVYKGIHGNIMVVALIGGSIRFPPHLVAMYAQ